MQQTDDIQTPARRQFITSQMDNMTVNDDAMLDITLNNENSSVTSENDALLKSRTNQTRGLRTLERLRSKADLMVLSKDELELKTNMFYHISNPIARWKADRSPPIKMILQLLKTFCVVTQAILFMKSLTGEQSTYDNDAQAIFAKFLLPNSTPAPALASRTTPYNTYDYTAYSVSELQDILETAGSKFYNSTSTLFGGYGLEYINGSIRPIQVVLTQYLKAELNASDRSFVLNGLLNTTSFVIKPESEDGRPLFQQFLDNCGPDDCFQRFVRMDVYFYAMNIRILAATLAQCYRVTVMLSFDVSGGGKLMYSLVADLGCVECVSHSVLHTTDNLDVVKGLHLFLGIIVMLLCVASFTLTLKAIRKSFRLAKAMGKFYHTKLNIKLSWFARSPLFVYWHLITIVSDLLIFPGTAIKLLLDYHYPCLGNTIDVDSVRILLGVSVVLQAAVILRYISYFRQFNALSSALDIAIPRLVKFFLCAGVLFVAFMLCGWVVLGPFHYKFQTFDGTFYTLFTMLNGDDLWNTYTGITPLDDLGVYVFSQVFFTIFLMLFIYAVLNLFISLIIESYEYSQKQDPYMKDEVHKFVFSGPLTPGGVALRDLAITKHYVDPELIKCQSDD